MNSATALSDTVGELGKTFTGVLLQPADPGYETARTVYNAMIADIVDAIKLAREQQLEVAVRGGGHNVAGRSTIDGGVMIDLSPMTGICIDPKARTARAQGGVAWNLFNRETQLHGLAVTGGVISTTGIAGLTLGGGIGWLMGKHALALDNLLSVELVLADGGIVTASGHDTTRTSSGEFAAAAATLVWQRPSNTVCIRSDPSSPAALSLILSARPRMCCGFTATSPRRYPTSSL